MRWLAGLVMSAICTVAVVALTIDGVYNADYWRPQFIRFAGALFVVGVGVQWSARTTATGIWIAAVAWLHVLIVLDWTDPHHEMSEWPSVFLGGLVMTLAVIGIVGIALEQALRSAMTESMAAGAGGRSLPSTG